MLLVMALSHCASHFAVVFGTRVPEHSKRGTPRGYGFSICSCDVYGREALPLIWTC